MAFIRHFYLFLYSPANITGCLFGLLGLGLFFAGLLKAFWLAIVLGLYALGYLIVPANRRLELKIDASLNADEIALALEGLIKAVRKKKAASEVLTLLDSIKQSIVEILPYLAKQHHSGYDGHIIRQTALEYLPAMLETYLALPPVFARIHPVKDGKTATAIVIEQLQLMDTAMKKLAVDILRNDTEALLVHGNFLREKFQPTDTDWLGN